MVASSGALALVCDPSRDVLREGIERQRQEAVTNLRRYIRSISEFLSGALSACTGTTGRGTVPGGEGPLRGGAETCAGHASGSYFPRRVANGSKGSGRSENAF